MKETRNSKWQRPCLLVVLLSLASPVAARVVAPLEPLDQNLTDRVVGQIRGKCCRPGRRWGCDPEHVEQSGCVAIDINNVPKCVAEPPKNMLCTASYCRPTNPEHLCHMHLSEVGVNRCRPTGRVTTVGCNENEWQCGVEMTRYDSPEASTTTILTCMSDSTICALPYSWCD